MGLAALACGMALSAAVGRAPAEQPADIAALVSALASAGDAAARDRAAAELLRRIDSEPARSALQSALWDDRPAGVRRAVAVAVADAPAKAGPLVRSLGTALAEVFASGGPEADALDLLRALSRFSERQAVAAVIESALPQTDVSAAVRSRVFATLAVQTARDDLGEDAEAWRAWWRQARWLDDREWSDEHARARAERVHRVEAQAADAGQRLAELYRRLHAQTAEAERDRLLVEMITSAQAEVRRAGFSIVMLNLMNARPVSDAVCDAAEACLADPLLSIRADAARVLELVDRPGPVAALWDALEREQEAVPAAAMLRAAARHPDPAVVGPALKWIAPGAPAFARAAASEALLSAFRAGVLVRSDAAEVVRRSLEGCSVGGLPASSLRLAAALGLTAPLVAQLSSADRSAARSAAEALAELPDSVPMLLEAAADHPDLFAASARAVARHRPTSEGYHAVALLPAPDPVERDTLLRDIAVSMPPDEVVRLASSIADLPAREALLARVVSPMYLARTDDPAGRVELALMLARTRLALRRPADALAAIDMLPKAWQGPRVETLLVATLLCLGRFDEAEARDAGGPGPDNGATTLLPFVDAWLDAIELAPDRALAATILRRFETRFPGALPHDRAERLRALKQALKSPQ